MVNGSTNCRKRCNSMDYCQHPCSHGRDMYLHGTDYQFSRKHRIMDHFAGPLATLLSAFTGMNLCSVMPSNCPQHLRGETHADKKEQLPV